MAAAGGATMNEQDLLRIVRNILSSVVDLVDSNDQMEIPAVLRNVRDGTAGFCSLLEEVIDDEEGFEDITYEPENDAE
jgi:hypothetical protein